MLEGQKCPGIEHLQCARRLVESKKGGLHDALLLGEESVLEEVGYGVGLNALRQF